MEKRRAWAGLASRYGAAGESHAWKHVFEHYYWDRLEQAHRAASELGAGAAASGLIGFRTIEGEYSTRQRSTLHEVNEWLTVEVIEEELPEPVQVLSKHIVSFCDIVAKRLGFEHGPSTLVTVLSKDSNVPWMPGRHGFCVDKYPYDKICIPNFSTHDHDDLKHVVQHEYAHVITLNLSNGQCPLWLDEAIAMVAGGGADRRIWAALASGRAQWLAFDRLSSSFLRNREDDHERQIVWHAYQQSAVIGFYLANLKGEQGLAALMRGYANNTLIKDFMMRVKGQEPTDEALREVYDIDTKQLFELAHSWLKQGGNT